MKFTKVFLLSAATTLVASLSSCTDNDLGFTANSIKFEQSFVEHFGNIDPNQNWGFEDMPVVNTRGVKTRGNRVPMNDKIVVDKNEWVVSEGIIQTTDDALGIEIPGWPNFDGRYYAATQGNEAVAPSSSNVLPANCVPAGDVTDYEIDFVSRWFREHPNPGKEPINLTDFFIQVVSADKDRVNKNGSIAKYGNTDSGILNQLEFGRDDVTDWLHANNFNGGNTNNYSSLYNNDNAVIDSMAYRTNPYSFTQNWRQIQFVRYAGVNDFRAHSDQDNGWLSDWALKTLTWDEPVTINNVTKWYRRTGTYLVFDTRAYKSSEELNIGPDNYYSNWIIKISPAKYVPTKVVSARVMCEDLGTTDDFDFNDVVFDVSYTKVSDGNYTAHITVQAVGGTLPLYIGDKSHEVHEMFGFYNCKTMINTDKDRHLNSNDYPTVIGQKPQTFELTGLRTSNPKDIPVIVTHKDKDNHALDIELKAEKGEAPQKFCVPVYVTWANERVDILDAYPYFNQWVGNNSGWTCAVGLDPKTFVSGTPLKTNYGANIWFSPAGDSYFNGTNLYDPESMTAGLNGGSAAGSVTLWAGQPITLSNNSPETLTGIDANAIKAYQTANYVRVWFTSSSDWSITMPGISFSQYYMPDSYSSGEGYCDCLVSKDEDNVKKLTKDTFVVSGNGVSISKIEIY